MISHSNHFTPSRTMLANTQVLVLILGIIALRTNVNADDIDVVVFKIMSDGYYNQSMVYSIENNITMVKSVDIEMTICAWLSPYRYGEGRRILEILDDEKKLIGLLLNFDNLVFTLNDMECKYYFTEHSFDLQEWSHFCFLISGSRQEFYVDGALKKANCQNTVQPLNGQKLKIFIGGVDVYDGYMPFSGKIADLRVYQRFLTEAELKKVANLEQISETFVTVDLPEFTLPASLDDVVSGVGDTVDDVVSGFGDTVGDVVSGVGDTVDGVVSGVGDTVGDLVSGVGDTVDGVVSGVGDTVGDVVSGIGDTVNGVVSDVGDTVDGIVSGGGDTVDGVVSDVGDTVGDIESGVGDSVDWVVSGVGDTVGDVVSGGGDTVDGVVSGVDDTVGDVESGVGDSVDWVVSGVGDTVGDVVSSVDDTVDGVVSGVGDTVGGVVSAVSDTVDGVVSGVGDTVGDVVSSVDDTVDGVVSGVGDTVGDVVSAVSDTVDGVVSGVGDTVGDVVSGGGDTFDGVVSGVGDTVGDVVSGGGDTVDGVVSGVGDVVSNAGDTVDSVLSGSVLGGGGLLGRTSNTAAHLILDVPVDSVLPTTGIAIEVIGTNSMVGNTVVTNSPVNSVLPSIPGVLNLMGLSRNSPAIMERDKRAADSEQDVDPNLGITKENMKGSLLLLPRSQNMVTAFQNRATFKEAAKACSTLNGSLMDNLFNENERLFSTYSGVTNIIASRIWLTQLPSNVDTNSCRIASDDGNSYVTKEIPCSSSVASVVCILAKNTVMNLYGTDFEVSQFSLLPNTYLEFETSDGLRLRYSSRTFILESVLTKTLISSTTIANELQIMGVKQWPIGYNSQQDLTFTICREKEFTCPDGGCIPISATCNLKADCLPNGYDEKVCEVGMPHQGFYEKSLAPISSTGEKAKVSLDLILERVIDINMDDAMIDMTLKLKVRWRDHRLLFKFLAENRADDIESDIYKNYWHPTIEIDNAVFADKGKFFLDEKSGSYTAQQKKEGYLATYTAYEAMFYKGENVELTHTKSADVSILCPMKLFLYPFDKQECSFSLILLSNLYSDVEWDVKNSEAYPRPGTSLTLYENLQFKASFNDSTEKVLITISVTRKNGAILLNTFLPCVILQSVGILTFILPIDDYSDRLSITLTCFLVMAALFIQVSTTLPESAEPKVMDIWMFVHMAMLFVVFLFQLFVIYYNNKKQDQESSPDKWKKEKFFINKLLKQHSTTVSPMHSDFSSLKSETLSEMEGKQKAETSASDEKSNVIGFVICTVIYLTFIVVYFIIVVSLTLD